MTATAPATPGLAIEIAGLTKRFGSVLAVDDLSFHAEPGRVTGFLGPNGSGKTTTLRCLLGLVRPTAGTAAIGSQSIRAMPAPARLVGATLEASGFHPGRTAEQHLRSLAAASGLPSQRVGEVLQIVGLPAAARRRVGGFSLGMRQRLSLAGALLGDPRVLVLDEPANGLDPEGIAWLRELLRERAAAGCTVLVSSHALSEIEQTADDVVIIANGRLRYAGSIASVQAALTGPAAAVADSTPPLSRVCSPQIDALAAAITRDHPAVRVQQTSATELLVDLPPAQIGATAFRAGVELHELRSASSAGERSASERLEDGRNLEAAFLQMTAREDQAPGDRR